MDAKPLALRFFSVRKPGQRRDLAPVSDVARAVDLALPMAGSQVHHLEQKPPGPGIGS
jgi:hypothetical protein